MAKESNEILMQQYAILTKLSSLENQVSAILVGLASLEQKILKGVAVHINKEEAPVGIPSNPRIPIIGRGKP